MHYQTLFTAEAQRAQRFFGFLGVLGVSKVKIVLEVTQLDGDEEIASRLRRSQ